MQLIAHDAHTNTQNLEEMQQRFSDFQAAAEARAAGTGTVNSAPALKR